MSGELEQRCRCTHDYMSAEKRRQLQSPRVVVAGEGDCEGFSSIGEERLLDGSLEVGVGFVRMSSVEFLRMPRLTDLSAKMGWTLDRSPIVL